VGGHYYYRPEEGGGRENHAPCCFDLVFQEALFFGLSIISMAARKRGRAVIFLSRDVVPLAEGRKKRVFGKPAPGPHLLSPTFLA